MPCITEKTAMDQAWNDSLNSGLKFGLYGAGTIALIGSGSVALGVAAGGEAVTLGGATIPASALGTVGFATIGAGVGALGVSASNLIDAGTSYLNYLSEKEAYEECLASQIKFQPSTPTVEPM